MARLLLVAADRRKEALKRLEKACDYLDGRAGITLSGIEDYIAEQFGSEAGPRAQSISNERKRELGMYTYVEARKRETTPTRGKPRSLLTAIEGLSDIDLRNQMRDMVDQFALIKTSFERAKFLLKTLRPGVDVDDLISGAISERPSHITDENIIRSLCAMRQILADADRLKACGLVSSDGAILRRSGTMDELLDARTLSDFTDFVDSLRSTAKIP